ncbi:MAG TPA: hypothetical protein VLK32_02590 [Bacillota bacterium]|nr:hypothetical protein [Bacillota bacterium]
MASEVKPQEAASLSPWGVLIWKLDALDKRLDAMNRGFNRRFVQLEARVDRLESRVDRLAEDGRSNRQSYVVLQLTTVLGFLAMLNSFWLVR